MVTKLDALYSVDGICFILAKNHMVTKHILNIQLLAKGLILAKNHMVTKL